jgi:tRNA A-37 threonylcarbamoyl transferase component Bud32
LSWKTTHDAPADFASLAQVFALEGEKLTDAPRSEVIRIERGGIRYYIKRYRLFRNERYDWTHYPFRTLRHLLSGFLSTPRVKAEWKNLRRFSAWGIPAPQVVAHGLQRVCGLFIKGAIATRELPGTQDLASLFLQHDPRLKDPAWVRSIVLQVAHHARLLHRHRFIHNDLKWRNILVDGQGTAYFIDCPWGRLWPWPGFARRREKDLATLDKVACQALSRTARLRFYLAYAGKKRLSVHDKASIARIVHFFDREK